MSQQHLQHRHGGLSRSLLGGGRWARFSLLGLVLVSGALMAQVRPEIASSLRTAQEAIASRKPDEALKLLAVIQSNNTLSEAEALPLERLKLSAALDAQQIDLAASTLKTILAMKSLPDPDRLSLLEQAVSLAQRRKDPEGVVDAGRQYALRKGSNPGVQLLLIQAYAQLKRQSEALQEIQDRQAKIKASGKPASESELKVMAFAQAQFQQDAAYLSTMTELLSRHPNQAYWSDLLNTMGRSPRFNIRLQLDVSRLMEETGVLVDADDYLEMARFAIKAGLPHEALRVLDLGSARALSAKGPAASSFAKVRAEALARSREDEKAVAVLAAKPNDAAALAQRADIALAQGQWSAAADLYQRALQLGSVKRESELRLHAGIALLRSQQKERAREVLRSISGDEAVQSLAQLWLLRAQ